MATDKHSSLREALAARGQKREALLAAHPTEADLLERIRQAIRTCRDALPTYRRVQDDARYSATVEDIEDVEQRYAQLKNDRASVFDYEDYVDLLLDIEDTGAVITHVLLNYSTPEARSRKPRRLSTLWLVGIAVAIVLVARQCGAI